MRPVCILGVLSLALLLTVPVGLAATWLDPGDLLDSDSFFSSGRRDRDRDDDDDRRSRSSDRDTVRVELSDGRIVRVDEEAYDFLRRLHGDDLSDEDILAVANVRQCELERDGEVVSRDCDRVRRAERQALRAHARAMRGDNDDDDDDDDRRRLIRNFDRDRDGDLVRLGSASSGLWDRSLRLGL
ncbi:MAG TPA: hypothetical protein VNZ52_10395 [Candidatus Thermoplasmatota archaeon]|nr:hypothetical protein [Candidatus Thermoplasmatota archaeon]